MPNKLLRVVLCRRLYDDNIFECTFVHNSVLPPSVALKGIGLSLILDPDDVSAFEERFKIVTEPLLFDDAIVSNSYVIYTYFFLIVIRALQSRRLLGRPLDEETFYSRDCILK